MTVSFLIGMPFPDMAVSKHFEAHCPVEAERLRCIIDDDDVAHFDIYDAGHDTILLLSDAAVAPTEDVLQHTEADDLARFGPTFTLDRVRQVQCQATLDEFATQ